MIKTSVNLIKKKFEGAKNYKRKIRNEYKNYKEKIRKERIWVTKETLLPGKACGS